MNAETIWLMITWAQATKYSLQTASTLTPFPTKFYTSKEAM